MYEYHCQLLRIVDGDTIEINVELGFDMELKRQKVRLYGLDTAESRTKDKLEDRVGEFTTAALRDWVHGHSTTVLKSREFDRGKYGRILGDIEFYDTLDGSRSWSSLMRESGLAVANNWTKEQKTRYWHLMYERLYETGAIDYTRRDAQATPVFRYHPDKFIWPTPEEIRDLIDESADKD